MKSVDKNQIEAVSEKYRVAEITAEKVIWLTRVLAELSGSRIAEDFALMGGSAIVWAYLQFGRAFHEQQGAGLGLTIAKRLAELYGGRMEFDISSGQGLTVRVFLPVCVPTTMAKEN